MGKKKYERKRHPFEKEMKRDAEIVAKAGRAVATFGNAALAISVTVPDEEEEVSSTPSNETVEDLANSEGEQHVACPRATLTDMPFRLL